MQAILKFKLPQESEEHKMALNGARYYCVIESVLNHVRQKLKHSYLPEEQEKLLEEIRDLIGEEINN